jgi:dTMP kinase
MLIAIEGIDGSGKTTIARHLVNFLKRKGYDAVLFREPSDSEYGRILRETKKRLNPEEELELFLLDREEDVRRNITPALKAGKIVVMDRYYLSNIAYQSARGIDAGKIKELNEKIAPKPDLVILLDVKPETGIERVRKRGKLSPFEDLEYLKKVRESYLELADDRTIIVDAEKPVEEVIKEVERIILSFLKK